MKRLPGIAALALALVAAFTACRQKAPVAPAAPVPPRVVAVQPPARSAGQAYDGQIWALFDRALDPKSVDTTTVFLKKDTQRLACLVGYEPNSRRIVVVPRVPLALNTTYTVIVTGLVRGGDGLPLGADYFWQFSTSSIRRLTYLAPAPGELVSSVAMLGWVSPEAVPGQLLFDIYAGPDSFAVLSRTVPLLARTSSTYYLPRQYWPAGQRVYWAVSTTNQATGERLDSPVSSFVVYPDGLPTHVVNGQATDWGGFQFGRVTQYCSANNLIVGSGYNAVVRLDLDPGRMGTRVKSARLVMYALSNWGAIPTLTAWSCSAGWVPCGVGYPGPPYPEGDLGPARVGTSSNQIVIESVALAAWAEAMLKRANLSGVVLTQSSPSLMTVNMSQATYPPPTIEVTVYD